MAEIDPESLLFQKHCKEADRVVTLVINSALAQGIDPAALASGALFAVVRLHLGFAPIRAAGPVFRAMLPALRKTVQEVVALDREPEPELPRKLDS
jgi:hypothetical protein